MNFEKLEVWKQACQLSADVYMQLKELRDFGFRDQLTRSSLSVPSNIAEGMVRPTWKDKIRFLHIANGSCAEMRTQIYIGMKIDYLPKDMGNAWVKETKLISSMLVKLIERIDKEG